MKKDMENKDFNKPLADISVINDSKKLEDYILSKIKMIESPVLNVIVEQEEVLKIIVSFKDTKETFEMFDISPETIDVTIEKVNKYVEGLWEQ